MRTRREGAFEAATCHSPTKHCKRFDFVPLPLSLIPFSCFLHRFVAISFLVFPSLRSVEIREERIFERIKTVFWGFERYDAIDYVPSDCGKMQEIGQQRVLSEPGRNHVIH